MPFAGNVGKGLMDCQAKSADRGVGPLLVALEDFFLCSTQGEGATHNPQEGWRATLMSSSARLCSSPASIILLRFRRLRVVVKVGGRGEDLVFGDFGCT